MPASLQKLMIVSSSTHHEHILQVLKLPVANAVFYQNVVGKCYAEEMFTLGTITIDVNKNFLATLNTKCFEFYFQDRWISKLQNSCLIGISLYPSEKQNMKESDTVLLISVPARVNSM